MASVLCFPVRVLLILFVNVPAKSWLDSRIGALAPGDSHIERDGVQSVTGLMRSVPNLSERSSSARTHLMRTSEEVSASVPKSPRMRVAVSASGDLAPLGDRDRGRSRHRLHAGNTSALLRRRPRGHSGNDASVREQTRSESGAPSPAIFRAAARQGRSDGVVQGIVSTSAKHLGVFLEALGRLRSHSTDAANNRIGIAMRPHDLILLAVVALGGILLGAALHQLFLWLSSHGGIGSSYMHWRQPSTNLVKYDSAQHSEAARRRSFQGAPGRTRSIGGGVGSTSQAAVDSARRSRSPGGGNTHRPPGRSQSPCRSGGSLIPGRSQSPNNRGNSPSPRSPRSLRPPS